MDKYKLITNDDYVVEARQYDSTVEMATELIDWMLEYESTGRYHDEDSCIMVNTPRGTMGLGTSEWLVKTPSLEPTGSEFVFEVMGPVGFSLLFDKIEE